MTSETLSPPEPLGHRRPVSPAKIDQDRQRLRRLGVSFTALSTSAWALSWLLEGVENLPFFVVEYTLVWIYLITGWASAKAARTHGFWLQLLLLALISCFGLNRDLPVFPPSSTWLSVVLTLFGGAVLLYHYRAQLPGLVNVFTASVFGFSFPLMVYAAVVLAPLYGIGLMGTPVLGLSLHVFVPLLLAIALGIALLRLGQAHPSYRWAWGGGLAGAFLCVVGYVAQWSAARQHVTQLYRQQASQYSPELPTWVAVAQQLEHGWFTRQFLLTEVAFNHTWPQVDDVFGSRRGGEQPIAHDPLVNIAAALAQPGPSRSGFRDGDMAQESNHLTRQDRVKILEAMYDSRHQTEERLWSGDQLRTEKVVTNVRLYPKFRISYTEKQLFIKHLDKESWRGQQEAVYTFQLPEGGAVTSLSLWVAGEERPGYLTTKQKADSAYRTIVGVERRDPSVVHWQEGNVVSVRVFPCTPQEVRHFKIGVSAPLRYQNGQLRYENITFKGPAPAEAGEFIQIKIDDWAGQPGLPGGFTEAPGGFYQRDAAYQPDWHLEMPAPPPAPGYFTFGGQGYQIEADPHALTSVSVRDLYLDLNQAWETEEVAAILTQAAQIRAKVWHWHQGQMLPLTLDNWPVAQRATETWHFSLFPLHRVPQPATALLVTKAEAPSPNLKDLATSPFATQLKDYLQQNPTPLRTFSLAPRLNAYLRTLHELRAMQVEFGDLATLQSRLARQQFPLNPENAQTLALGPAQMLVRQVASPSPGAAKAPDHLLRLFAYNHLLQQLAPHYFTPDYFNPELMKWAARANVVSPVSSLVVLETQADYERFDIKKSQDALGNATMNGAGAVPEPHEWAMIALAAIVLLRLYLKHRASGKLAVGPRS
ncbi:MAG: XrtN system VIT domain-containing protein [Bernardetiaceae bacterium]|jgi:XrtN system VIT domain protein|nr:XrtN system VIT domain-containing protein [Bernardetiaceae bacterium]